MAFIEIGFNTKRPLILGRGGFGTQLNDWLMDEGWGSADFLDDNAPDAVGGLRDYVDPAILKRGRPAFVALGDNKLRVELLQKLAAQEDRHLILLTATPHSGDHDAFYNLLSLLRPEFSVLRDDQNQRASLREELARHFVQRRRGGFRGLWRPRRAKTKRSAGVPAWRTRSYGYRGGFPPS